MNKRILITGANSGLGKESARQLARRSETEKIYLACRNPEKAREAKRSLERSTGRSIFEIVIMDVSDLDSVRSAVEELNEPIDALIMNAGGMGGKDPLGKSSNGVSSLVALYAGSEGARGVEEMKMRRPQLQSSSVEEFSRVIDGSFFSEEFEPMEAYGYVKYMAALWISSEARKHRNLRLITMSPGFTRGTAAMDDLPPRQRFMFKYIMMPIVAPLKGMVHKLEKGAKRFVDGITDDSFVSGVFYASKANKLVGPVMDQSTIFPDLNNTDFQDNASEAIHRFILEETRILDREKSETLGTEVREAS